jgi:hypothetical protein
VKPRGAVYFELTRQGRYAKATAIDAETGTEVSVVGPADAADSILKANALRKLEFMLGKQGRDK